MKADLVFLVIGLGLGVFLALFTAMVMAIVKRPHQKRKCCRGHADLVQGEDGVSRWYTDSNWKSFTGGI